MEDDNEYKKLAVDERCVHKLWKARVDGYEEAAKIFREIDDEKSPEWNKFIPLIKKFVGDSNAMAQEKGLEATLIFVENCAHAGKTVGEVMSGIVTKCIAAPKTKTKELSVQVTLMYVEIEKHEMVLEELIKGAEHKNPKIVVACTAAITLALKEFGHKVINVKPIIKKLPALLSDRDKFVRDEAKLLAIEIFRWIGQALKPQLASLPAVLVGELEVEFEKVTKDKCIPTRYLKSQQEKQAKEAATTTQEDEKKSNDDCEQEEAEFIDPLDLIDPVDILSKLPKDFYDKLEQKKWTDRKEALETLEPLVQHQKLESGDYADLVKALKKVISKDSNVVLVAMAGKCLANLAKGLAKKFQPYACACIAAILEKFKEKKANVVTALKDAIDAIYPSTNLEVIQEDIIEALNNKNPSVKAETASFLSRAFSKTLPTVLNKKLLKAYITALLKTLNEPDPNVRDVSAEAIGTAMKLVGEKNISPFLTDIDNLKMTKIKECCEKAVITIKIPGVKKERPVTAPPKATLSIKGGSVEPKAVTRPTTAGPARKTVKKSTPVTNNSALAKSGSSAKVLPTERDMSSEEIDEKIEELLPSDVINGLCDANWKTRLSSMETFMSTINDLNSKPNISQILIKTILKKPGLKDTNFQVLKYKLDLIKIIVEKFGVTVITADYVMTDITEKLGDAKNSIGAGQALTAIAEAIRLEYVVTKVLEAAFEQKSPKVQQEALLWVNNAIKEFGFQVNPKLLIEDAKKGVQMTNPVVRAAGISLLGTMYLYMGNSLSLFFDGEKPALKQQIQTEFDRYTDQKPPTPTRGVVGNNKQSIDSLEEEDADEQVTPNLSDLLPRVDISPLITEALLAEIADKNWKTRNEGLNKLQGLLNEAKLIKPNIGDLPLALSHRLIDSNAKIAQTTLAICQQLATSMGPSCKQYVRVLFPGFLHGLSDGKSFIRSACIACINVWGDQCGYKEFFEGEMIADSLKSGSPSLKTEVWGWLAEKLPNIPPKTIPKEELIACLPHLYANICDRSVDVRKNANDAVLGIMIHIGFEAMVKAVDKQKPSSKKDIQTALDKARPNLPLKPLPKLKQQSPEEVSSKPQKNVTSKNQKPASTTAVKAAPPSRNKKEEEVDTSPLLAINSSKNQRLLDEQKLRVLKWTFTTPREEFTELLKEQMTSANVNKGLMANMFHEDFRYHLKVIDALIEDLPNNDKGLMSNLDLILKWLSLRFYDTNPSVLLKGLEYLNMVFQLLIENEYILAENEGYGFIPHLLTKIGDPKDAVRNGVKSILHQICLLYPFQKVFLHIMDALKSKNARQRTECLEELGYLIETYGLIVCNPTPQVALKEIAKQISDRDNSVRNAALNCVVQAYFLAGEKVYKLIGNLSEKEMSMLDERIKRAKKNRKPIVEIAKATSTVTQHDVIEVQEIPVEEEILPVEEAPVVVSSSGKNSQNKQIPPQPDAVSHDDSFINNFKLNFETNSSQAQKQFEPASAKVSGPFGLDPEIIADIEKGWVKTEQMQNIDVPKDDISFLYSPLKIGYCDGITYPSEKLEKLMTKSPTMPTTGVYSVETSPPKMNTETYNLKAFSSGSSTISSTTTTNLADNLPKLDPNLVRLIRSIGSNDSLTARAAMNEINDILDSVDKQAVLRDYEDLYLQSILKQYKNLSTQPINDSLVMYQPLLASTFSFFNSKTLGKKISIPCLENIMSVLLGLMADNKLANGDDGQYIKVINGICLKILDRTNFTNSNCALIRLLKETCSNTGLPKFTDLLMKCIWRNVKVMPDRSHELDYDLVLLEVHEFMLALPSVWWQQRQSDTPLRTIKTIIHNMAKIKGNSILQHLSKIPNHSELHTYLIRILKNMQKDPGTANIASPQRSSHQMKEGTAMSKTIHETILNIFKLISDKENSNEGLAKLYEFKVQNPNMDITPFFKGANPYFQKYIENGLAELERAHHKESGDNKVSQHAIITMDHRITSTNSKIDPDYWMDKLNTLKVRANLPGPNAKENSGHLMDNKIADENLNLNHQIQPSKLSIIQRGVSGETLSSNRLEMIQQKLAQIKQQK